MSDQLPESFALTSAQQNLWAGQVIHPESTMYNMALAVTLRGELNKEAMHSAWLKLQSVFQSLTIRIVEHSDGFVQVAATDTLPMQTMDYTGSVNPHADAKRELQSFTETPFELSDILTCARLISLSQDEHIWYIKQHHVVTDAWSFKVIWAALAKTYLAETRNAQWDIESMLYSEFTGMAGDGPDDKAIAHWRDRGRTEPLTCFNKDTPNTTITAAPRLSGGMNLQRWEKICQATQLREATSLSPALSQATVVLAVLIAYLYRISSHEVITVGVTASNRGDSRFLATPGLFVEVLPVKVAIDRKESFRSLLAKVRAELMAHMKYSQPGAGELVDSSSISAVFNFINVNLDAIEGLDHFAEWLHAGSIDAQHAMRLQLSDWNGSGQLQMDFDLNRSIFTEDRCEIMPKHWWRLCDGLIDAPDALINSIPLALSQIEAAVPGMKHQVENQIQPVLSQILNNINNNADSVAARCGDEVITYSELGERSDEVAGVLLKNNVSPGDVIGIHLGRSVELIISIVGVFKAGAAYVPLEISNPVERLRWMAEDAGLSVVITENRHLFAADGITSLCLDDLQDGPEQSMAIPSATVADHTAYILYTSGSTGRPKGVRVSQGALSNYINWAASFYGRHEALHFPLFTAVGFDLTLTSILLPLVTGGEIAVFRENAGQDASQLFDVFKDRRLNIVKLTPSHLEMLKGFEPGETNIRQMIVGGENLKTELATAIQKLFGGELLIHNEYGPTESTVGCIVHTFDVDTDYSHSVPIGRCISGVSSYVLNEEGLPQPAGCTGELYIGGDSLAEGYHGNAELTAASFTRVPALGSDTWYRTGDLVWLNDDDQLVYGGRLDDQIKVQGVRVEVAELESVAATLPGVSSAIAGLVELSDQLAEETHCVRCGLSSRFPDASINTAGVCSLCEQFASNEDRIQGYFHDRDEFQSVVEDIRSKARGEYDCLMLLSGGKDSSFALGQLIDSGLSVLAFTLDNGFISDQAKANIDRVCTDLGVDHQYGTTPSMNEIFADSLDRYSNVCNGCFKVLYTLSMRLAKDLGIKTIVTGLSRGQFFETRLTNELFAGDVFDIKRIDAELLDMRRAYHQTEDAVSRCMDVSHVRDATIFDEIQIVDFYRYYSVDLAEMYEYLEHRLPWVRPDDTGRSTNCLINDVGISVHKKEKGFHNYSLPYSWDVRLGHKRRDEALQELDDVIDEGFVDSVLKEIGYQPRIDVAEGEARLALYYVPTDKKVAPADVEQKLRETMPPAMIPSYIVPLDELPLTKNGKLARDRLPAPTGHRTNAMDVSYRAPETDTEQWLVKLWSELLRVDSIGVDDSFFALGGDSLAAIRVISRVNQSGYTCSVADLFEHSSIARFATIVERSRTEDLPEKSADKATAFSSLSAGQLDQLSKVLGSRKHAE